ncbi:polysaccharide deacetylase family protein [Paenibacillus pasadenensis]|uniref:polysaccharide deacetylase family protein n=1 Tax=Paenibacillus pasadenensis TaxID=217090 RepID=UPI00203DD71D|nr:polysaccharide deacetylase family protein [Paenibacillus pasadenensis]MCM3746595.1 polysaccharide deacetylase family protein [Paenibacillus pasadenensis]
MAAVKIKFDRFPDGLHKAATFSFDDGREHDRRLIELMNQYELKGTFHLNSGLIGHDGYIRADEVAELYKGHEVSAHTVTHPFLEQSPGEQIVSEIMKDREALEGLVGYPVRGMSYPFGTYDDRVVAMLPALGIEYARTIKSHGGFDMPADSLRWHPTCHHKGMCEAAERFLQSQPYRNRMELLFIWGHSYEFESDGNWSIIDRIGRLLQGQDSVWHATMGEIHAYRKALEALRFSVDRSMVHNPSATDVWFSADDELVMIRHGETVRL